MERKPEGNDAGHQKGIATYKATDTVDFDDNDEAHDDDEDAP